MNKIILIYIYITSALSARLGRGGGEGGRGQK